MATVNMRRLNKSHKYCDVSVCQVLYRYHVYAPVTTQVVILIIIIIQAHLRKTGWKHCCVEAVSNVRDVSVVCCGSTRSESCAGVDNSDRMRAVARDVIPRNIWCSFLNRYCTARTVYNLYVTGFVSGTRVSLVI